MIEKNNCEICGFNKKKALHLHHIVPRTDPTSTNLDSNLACICSNCHNLVHSDEIIIEGRFQSSIGNKLFWHFRGDSPVVREGVILLADGTAEIRN